MVRSASVEALPVTPLAEYPIGDELDDHPQDECGVFGIWAPGQDVLQRTILGLEGLQHRGHSGAGIAYEIRNSYALVGDPGLIVTHKGFGRVNQAIPELYRPNEPDWKFDLATFDDYVNSRGAIGHTRYSTAESEEFAALHPHVLLHGALAHNGELSNVPDILFDYGIDPESAPSDSAGLAILLNHLTEKYGDVVPAMREILPQLEGAYCLTIFDKGRLITARDPWGYHPLALGELPDGAGYAVASESVVLQETGASFVRDIEPGEILVIGEDGLESLRIDRKEPQQFCAFEGIYTSRADGTVEGIPVRNWRINMGRFLAEDQPADVDYVIGVPETGLAAALGYSQVSGKELVPGIVKNVGSGRTFQLRGAARAAEISAKYSFDPSFIAGKDIALVDDSTIKGHTHRAIIAELKRLGAKSVHLRLSSWPYRNPCFMGMDTHDPKNLVAAQMTLDEFATEIGADSIGYNTPARIQEAADLAAKERGLVDRAARLCMSCFTGEYAAKPPKTVMLGMPAVRGSFYGVGSPKVEA